MRQTRPRQEFQFSTIKDRPDLDYVPAKTRDLRMMDLFMGTPRGSRIAVQQRVGIEALLATFNTIDADESYGTEELRAVADVAAIAAIGTAYHAFGEPEAENLGFRRIKIAKVYDPKTQEHLTASKLVGSVQSGLSTSAELAAEIEERTLENKDARKISDSLGRILATVGFQAAALHDGIDRQFGNDADVQHISWLSARAASRRSLDLSDKIGTRPTIAQLPDDQSPLRRYMNDNPWFVPLPGYNVLLNEIPQAMDAAFKRDEERFMLPY